MSRIRPSFSQNLFVKRFLLIIVSITLIILGSTIFSQYRMVNGQSSPPPSCPTCSSEVPRTIYAPTIGLPEAEAGNIVLNCRSLHEMEAIPTFYTEDGTAITGEAIHMQPSEMRFVSIESLIPQQERGKHVWGGMALSYTGKLMEVWAQITLPGSGQRGSSDVTFSILNNAGADTQEAVWWQPRPGKSVIALGNSSNVPIHTKLQFFDGSIQEVAIAPFATKYIRRNFGGNAPDGGESIKLITTGPAGSLKATGYVISSSNSGNNRYASSIRFYETPNTVQKNLFATNFRVKNSLSHVLLKNTSDTSITALPRFVPNDGISGQVVLPAVTLAPNQITELDLQPLRAAAANRNDLDEVSVRIDNSGMPGSLIGALYSINQATGVIYDVPLRDSGINRNSTGAYPWRLDDDYTTVVSITNVGDEAIQLMGAIHYNGARYMIGLRQLEGGQTATFDLKKIRDQQIPDQNGNVIPLTATIGQFRWSLIKTAPSESRLIGRAEVVSRSGRVSSSYSCGTCCRDRGPYLESYPLLYADVSEFSFFTSTGMWYDCYDYPYGPSATQINYLTSSNTSIAQVGNGANYADIMMEGMSPGQTTWTGEYYFSEFFSDSIDCYGYENYVNTGGDMMVPPTVASISASLPSTKNPVTNTRPPAGTFTTSNLSTAFATGRTASDLLVIFKSSDANLTVTATGIVPTTASSSLKWKIDRDTNDSGLTGTPTLSTQTGATLTVTPNTSGNFRLICWYDANGNNSYDSGEERKVLRMAIVETTIDTSTCKFDAPTISNPGTFTGQQNAIETNNAMELSCVVTLKSGGNNRQVGLASVTLGDVGNLITDNFTINYPVPIPTPQPPSNQPGTEYEAPNGTSSNSNEWFPLPMVDTSKVNPGNEPTGSDSPFRLNSTDPHFSITGGEKRNVHSLDSTPGFGPWDGTHPVTNNIWQTTTGGNTFREFIVGYTNSFDRNYVCLAKGEWRVLPTGFNSGGFVWQEGRGASISIVSGISSLISGDSPQSGDVAGVQILGKSFVNEYEYKHNP